MLASRDDLNNKSINVNHLAPLVIVKTNATKKTSNSIKVARKHLRPFSLWLSDQSIKWALMYMTLEVRGSNLNGSQIKRNRSNTEKNHCKLCTKHWGFTLCYLVKLCFWYKVLCTYLFSLVGSIVGWWLFVRLPWRPSFSSSASSRVWRRASGGLRLNAAWNTWCWSTLKY